MSDRIARVRRFLDLHRPGEPLRMPNPWDAGFARLLETLGFQALATTSSGHAGTMGRHDYDVGPDAALRHAAEIVAATDLPVSADLENCFADDPAGVAETVQLAVAAGLAGCSVEDYTGDAADPIYRPDLAVERVAAAAGAAHSGPVRLVLTARSENFLHGRADLDDTIARLQAFQEAGADVLYAPGLTDAADIGRVVESVDLPLNVLALPTVPPVDVLAELGVKRISVGSGFNLVGIGAVAAAGRELLETGTYRFWAQAAEGAAARDAAFD